MKMSSKQEEKFIKAMTKTLNKYDDLIESGGNNWRDWTWYGYLDGCFVCSIFREGSGIPMCGKCPLKYCVNHGMYAMQRTLSALAAFGPEVNALNSLVRKAKARRRWLIRKIRENGYDYI